jgi:hypothetical protein
MEISDSYDQCEPGINENNVLLNLIILYELGKKTTNEFKITFSKMTRIFAFSQFFFVHIFSFFYIRILSPPSGRLSAVRTYVLS